MGSTSFDGLELVTAPGDVMTPRLTSEQLVAEAYARIQSRTARVADVGTGSGAVAVAIAAQCARAVVWATDVDERAVALARANVRRHDLERRVFVRRRDLLAAVPGSLDVIAANLPYLPANTAPEHPQLRGEPFAAVFAPGDGLDACRRLVTAAVTKLAPTGTLLVQFHRRVLVASPSELEDLRAFFDVDRVAA